MPGKPGNKSISLSIAELGQDKSSCPSSLTAIAESFLITFYLSGIGLSFGTELPPGARPGIEPFSLVTPISLVTEFFRGLSVQNSGHRQFVGFLKIPQGCCVLLSMRPVDRTGIQSFCFEGFLCFLDVVTGHNHAFVAGAWPFDSFRNGTWLPRHWFRLWKTWRRLPRDRRLRLSRLRGRSTSGSALSEERVRS